MVHFKKIDRLTQTAFGKCCKTVKFTYMSSFFKVFSWLCCTILLKVWRGLMSKVLAEKLPHSITEILPTFREIHFHNPNWIFPRGYNRI